VVLVVLLVLVLPLLVVVLVLVVGQKLAVVLGKLRELEVAAPVVIVVQLRIVG
jgi:hypothetical protein